MGTKDNRRDWHPSKIGEFWSDIASQHNVFHVYENEDKFIDLLAGFVGTGINAGDCNIVIATQRHLEKLEQNLAAHGLHINRLLEDERYYPIDADGLLQRFMIDDVPDENLFFQSINNIVNVAKKRKRQIRLYREMVSVLRATGNNVATRELESFWNKFSQIEQTLIFCAYPRKNFMEDECMSLKNLGFVNPTVIRNTQSLTHIMYANCNEVI